MMIFSPFAKLNSLVQNFLLSISFLLIAVPVLGQSLLKDINQADPGNFGSLPLDFTQLDSQTVMFSASTYDLGHELWRTDGTADGTVFVKDLNPGFYSGMDGASNMIRLGDQLLFRAEAGVDDELYITDGTESGTSLLMDLRSPGSSSPSPFVRLDSLVFFVANDGVHGRELWRTDGTVAGTYLFLDIQSGDETSHAFEDQILVQMEVIGNLLYFAADDGIHGKELWRSDGTIVGTYLVQDINPGTEGSACAWITPYQGKVLFVADNGSVGDELWITDPSNDNTELVADIYPGNISSLPSFLTEAGGIMYFAASGLNGSELFRSDGTAAGTYLFKDLESNSAAKPQHLYAMGSQLLFSAETRAFGRELWRTDGTEAGTIMLADINQERDGRDDGIRFNSLIDFLVVGDSLMYFLGRDGATTASTGDELWQTDGTPAGTQLVMDINPGTEGSDPHNFFLTESGSVLFVANDGVFGGELWIMEPSGVNTSIFPPQRVKSHLITSVFPNPFRESIQLNLQLQRPELVQLSIFDASGKLVYQSGEKQMLPGEQQLLWQPAALPTGMYFCQLRVGNQVDSRMILHQE